MPPSRATRSKTNIDTPSHKIAIPCPYQDCPSIYEHVHPENLQWYQPRPERIQETTSNKRKVEDIVDSEAGAVIRSTKRAKDNMESVKGKKAATVPKKDARKSGSEADDEDAMSVDGDSDSSGSERSQDNDDDADESENEPKAREKTGDDLSIDTMSIDSEEEDDEDSGSDEGDEDEGERDPASDETQIAQAVGNRSESSSPLSPALTTVQTPPELSRQHHVPPALPAPPAATRPTINSSPVLPRLPRVRTGHVSPFSPPVILEGEQAASNSSGPLRRDSLLTGDVPNPDPTPSEMEYAYAADRNQYQWAAAPRLMARAALQPLQPVVAPPQVPSNTMQQPPAGPANPNFQDMDVDWHYLDRYYLGR